MRRFIFPLLGLLLLSPAALLAVDADLIVPVTGTIPGAAGAAWQGELSIHNSGKLPVTLGLTLYGANGLIATKDVTIAARATVSYSNFVSDVFGLATGTGALAVRVDPTAVGTIAISSRVLNHTPAGEFGQDVPAITSADTLRTGATGVVLGPGDVGASRFNFGIFAVDASTIEWRLLRADGTVEKSVTEEYAAGTHVQYNGGVGALFAAEAENDDAIHARVRSGNAVVYGSIVANSSGDPTFVPGVKVREQFTVTLLGVDLDENGTIDIPDADGDGTLDSPVILYAGFLPNYFRVVTAPGDGTAVSLRILEAPRDTAVIDDQGTILSYPGIQYKGQTSAIILEASDGFGITEIVIPVIIR
jgi:hypothetical protein